MRESKIKGCVKFQPSLEFLKEILRLADMSIDQEADVVRFCIGPLDGMALEVSIEFHFKEV